MPRYFLYCLPLTRTSSPGASAVPASSEPSIAVDAPAASALAMSPEYCQAAVDDQRHTGLVAHRRGLEDRGDLRGAHTGDDAVVQIEPGPTPTFTASAPASTSAWRPSRVATSPPTTSTRSPTSGLSLATMSRTSRLWACAVSTMITSTPASTSAIARSHWPPVPTRGDEQTGVGVLGGVRVLLGLDEVLDGDQTGQPAIAVDDQELLDLVRRNSPSAASAETPSRAVISGPWSSPRRPDGSCRPGNACPGW